MPDNNTRPSYAVVYNENHEEIFSVQIHQTSLTAFLDEPANVSIEGSLVRSAPSRHFNTIFPPDEAYPMPQLTPASSSYDLPPEREIHVE